MPTIEELFAEAEKDNKTFHPVDGRAGLVWFPGNLAAGLAVQTTHIWGDIVHLIKIRRPQRDEYRRKLLLKYIVIELRSLIEVMDRLQGEVMKAAVIEPGKERPWRGLTLIESEEAKRLFKEYSIAKKSAQPLLLEIRHNIGAHRENLDWQQTIKLWDSMSESLIRPLIDVLPRVFAHVKELDLFEWNRSHEDGSFEVLGPRFLNSSDEIDQSPES